MSEALELLARHGDDAKILAGGQSLLPMMKLRIACPRYVVDVNGIKALAGLRHVDGRLVIGALCPPARIFASSPCRASRPSASSTVSGEKYSNSAGYTQDSQ